MTPTTRLCAEAVPQIRGLALSRLAKVAAAYLHHRRGRSSRWIQKELGWRSSACPWETVAQAEEWRASKPGFRAVTDALAAAVGLEDA